MKALDLVQRAQAGGWKLQPENGRLKLSGKKPMPAPLLNELRIHRDEVLTFLTADEREERAAIAEHDGGLNRVEAERQAFEATITHWLNAHPPEGLDPDTCAACGHPIGEIGKDAIPVLTGGGGHVWLHHGCHRPWMNKRRSEAIKALGALGLNPPKSISK